MAAQLHVFDILLVFIAQTQYVFYVLIDWIATILVFCISNGYFAIRRPFWNHQPAGVAVRTCTQPVSVFVIQRKARP